MLSPAQIRALRGRQYGMFAADSVNGPGPTIAALRRRGLVTGHQPHAELTPLGARVCRHLDAKEKSDV